MSVGAIILLGAPGAGKGTMAESIRALTPYIHVSTGDMLRDGIKNGTATGREAEVYMKRGDLVPDSIIVKLVMERLDQGDANARYMLDGFPRTLEQARLLDANFITRKATLEKVFLLDISAEVALERLTGRRVCRKCGVGFHIKNIPPKISGICDHCGGEVYQRTDDQKDTILNRLDVYRQQTTDLISYYEKKCLLVRIDSGRPRDETVQDIMKFLVA